MSKTKFVSTSAFDKYDYGVNHPLKMYRLKLTQELINSTGLIDPAKTQIINPKSASIDDAATFHNKKYLEVLKEVDDNIENYDRIFYGIGTPDCPAFPGIYKGSMLAAGGSLSGAEELINGTSETVFNIAGGLHHAHPDKASGFCYINDPGIAINKILSRFKKVAYIDIDAHAGDGVAYFFYKNPNVLTISTHESGRYLFPGTCFENEIGEGEGKGYCINIPFLPDSGDDVFIVAFDKVIVPLVETYNPDVIVTQLGVDTFSSDPLTDWNLTTFSFIHALSFFKNLKKPWLALGGGGYDVANICRAWTLAWAKMNNNETDLEIPKDWQELAKKYNVIVKNLKDKEPTKSGKEVHDYTESIISYLKKIVFPLL